VLHVRPVWAYCVTNSKTTRSLARMTDEQAVRLEYLARLAFEPDAFKPGLERAEAARRIAALEAKLRLLDGPPHTL
jgi:hypothetical protein